jgi:AcrR family transcriptional regulator
MTVIDEPSSGEGRVRRLRSDARRNHEQLLAAARDVFVEPGAGAPLDEVARRAGVGIGTLYRRFADRPTLLRAVVLDALEHTKRAAAAALAEESDGFSALLRYMHAALEFRVSAVIPLVLDTLDLDDAELGPAREASASLVQRIVDTAHQDGTLARDVTFADIGTLLVRLARPLPGRIPPELNDELSHRHLDLVVEGLRPVAGRQAPSGPHLERADLHAMRTSAQSGESRPADDQATQ